MTSGSSNFTYFPDKSAPTWETFIVGWW